MSWDSDEDDILNDFYRPALATARKYQRLAGYFSSTAFAVAISETLDFISRGGLMELVTSAELSSQDAEIMEQSVENREKLLAENLLVKLQQDSELFQKCHSILGWMLTNLIDGRPQLQIKIAIPQTRSGTDDKSSIYHQKVGIMTMGDGKIISFSGSVNETGKAWKDNIEEFKAFKSWGGDTNKDAVDHDIRIFNKFWSNSATRTKVYNLPNAVREHLIKVRPQSSREFDETIADLKIIFELEKRRSIRLYQYQVDAVEKWEENNFRGFFEMATGTGKTFVALACVNKLQQTKNRLIVIFACPQIHLVNQWVEQFHRWNAGVSHELRLRDAPLIECHSENSSWKSDLMNLVSDFNKKKFSGGHFLNDVYIFSTHDTISSNAFRDIIETAEGDVLIVADEVHAIGSEKRSLGLLDKYEYRVGLSATPRRHMDTQGNQILTTYFNGTVFEYNLRQAIDDGRLVRYDYFPHYVELTYDELTRYRELTKRLAIKLSDPNFHPTDSFENHFIEIERAKIIATAERKYDAFRIILDSFNNNLSRTLVYCHEDQLPTTLGILNTRGIGASTVTWKNPSDERIMILKNLSNRHFDCVVAIKCLDEGVDIPSVNTAIILASTGNPRQYIQRRGRVLRRDDKMGKTKAVIHDIIVIPQMDPNSIVSRLERKITAKELLRHKEFADIADNRPQAIELIRNVATRFGIDLDALSDDYVESL